MRQTVKNRMIKSVQLAAVGMMATASIMGTAASMGVKMDNIPFNVLAHPFQAVMTQGVAATQVESGVLIQGQTPEENITYSIQDDGTLTISGKGDCFAVMANKIFNNREDIKKVVIGEGITGLANMVTDCPNITEIQLPQTLKTIGAMEFKKLPSLKQITIPDSVTTIGLYAFSECNNLTEIHGMNGVLSIEGAFGGLSGEEKLETTLDTDNEAVLGYNWFNVGRKIKENKEWYYDNDVQKFVADVNQKGSVADDYNRYGSATDGDKTYSIQGEDVKQKVESQTQVMTSETGDTDVYCTKASDWIITIPKDLIMSGDDESKAEYVVGVYGNVDPAKRVTVTPDASFDMINNGNPDIKYTAQVEQANTGINGIDIAFTPTEDTNDASQMSGSVTANLKKAGSYRGTMTFTVDYVDHT